MDHGTPDTSDAALVVMSHAEIKSLARTMGVNGENPRDTRRDTLRRIHALRDRPVKAIGQPQRPHTTLGKHLWIVVICLFIACCGWLGARWLVWGFVDVLGLGGVNALGQLIDWLAVVGFLTLLGMWFWPRRRVRRLLRPQTPNTRHSPPTFHEGREGDSSPGSIDKSVGHGLTATEDDYDGIRLYYQQNEHRGGVVPAPRFPASAQEYQEIPKIHILRRLATALLCFSSAQKDRERLQTTLHNVMTAREHEKQLPTAPEIDNLRSQRDRLQGRLQGSEEKAQTARSMAEHSQQTIMDMQRQLGQLEYENNHYQKELIRLKGKVWTFARVRPKIEQDQEDRFLDLTSRDQNDSSLILRGGQIDKKHLSDTEYSFDRVFHGTDTNQTVYKHIKPIVQAAMEGLDVAIILDGPSGSGKTHTMFEPPHGIAFSIASHLFHRSSLEEDPSGHLQAKISGFKIYREKLLDATDKKGAQHLYIRDPVDSELEVYRDGKFRTKVDGTLVSTSKQLISELTRILDARERRETEQNATSSRGHTICKLDFTQLKVEAGEPKKSCLFLVDLAGPEPFDSSPDADETISITQGRTELRNRMHQAVKLHRSRAQSDVRKRAADKLRLDLKNSTLTHILRDCFIRESRMIIIATVNPYAAKEHRPRIRETFEFVTKIREG